MMRNIRLIHFYLGVFFAPLIIFFAFTGMLQVFKLHESYRDTPGSQGDWVAWFGQFHKEQAWIPPKVAPAKAAPAAPAKAPAGSLWAKPMKWLVASMGIALMATTFLGLYMAFEYPGRRKWTTIALVAGIAIPLTLMAF
jgi:hypothetical protein